MPGRSSAPSSGDRGERRCRRPRPAPGAADRSAPVGRGDDARPSGRRPRSSIASRSAPRPSAARRPRRRRAGRAAGCPRRSPRRSSPIRARAGALQIDVASRASAPPPRPSSSPCASSRRAPSAWTIPAPPSVEALPPSPSTIWRRAASDRVRDAPDRGRRSRRSAGRAATARQQIQPDHARPVRRRPVAVRARTAPATGSPVGPTASTRSR